MIPEAVTKKEDILKTSFPDLVSGHVLGEKEEDMGKEEEEGPQGQSVGILDPEKENKNRKGRSRRPRPPGSAGAAAR